MENPMVLRANEFSIPVTMEVDIPGALDQGDHMVAGFDDDLGSRGSPHRAGADIRSHLDDLARRHPDLADQLRGFPGGEEPTYSGDKTATDGAEPTGQDGTTGTAQSNSKIGNLQNHGLRNTVPLVEPSPHPRPMSQDTGSSRSPRAQSAPPKTSEEPQRFVSKIEIQPNHNQIDSEKSEMYIPTGADENQVPASQQTGQQANSSFNNHPQQQHQAQQQHEPAKTSHVKQPNVRHIPIFVEGRDAPIVNRDHEPSEAPSYHPPPPYHEPSAPHHQQRYREPIFEPMYSNNTPVDRPFGGVHHTSGGVGFDIPMHSERGSYRSPNQFGGSGISKPAQQRPPPQEKVHRVFNQHQQQADPSHQSGGPPHTRSQHHSTGSASHDVPDSSSASGTAGPSPPPKKMSRPKTPLENIQEVQAEVDKLKAEIEKFNGTSRSDKEYIYLDEMLTRELLKLDNVDSGGVEEIRNLRRTTIKNIQAAIAALEAKVSSAGAANDEAKKSNTEGGEAVEGGESQGQPSDGNPPMDVDTNKPEGEVKTEGGENKEGGDNQSQTPIAEGKDQSGEATAQTAAPGDQN